MNAGELRVGNYYMAKSPEKTEYEPKFRLDYFSLYQALQNEINLKGIPITTEWLEDLGFIKTNNGKYYSKYFALGMWVLIETNNMGYWIGCGDWNDDHQSVGLGSLSFVHNLQNLYFSITGQELTPL